MTSDSEPFLEVFVFWLFLSSFYSVRSGLSGVSLKRICIFAGQFIDVRLAALECLVDYVRVEGTFKDIAHLVNMIEKESVRP